METNGVHEQFSDLSRTSEEDIARLAYALWQARGEALGNPEQDWHQAEELLRNGQAKLAASAAHE
jgi:hypothetical protein